MSNDKNISTSQQQGQGITIGTQGNENIPTPEGTQEPRQERGEQADRHIPNQDRSSAASQERSSGQES
jgi:hypothetical protein